MIYVATHSNVAEWGAKSIENIQAASLGDEVEVVIQQTIPTGTKRLHITKDGTSETDLGSRVDSGDAKTLINFAKWGKETAPADKYALILWSHGSGWEPAEIRGIKVNQTEDYEPLTETEVNERSVTGGNPQIFFSSSMKQIVKKKTKTERDIAFDDGTGHSLDTIELGKALSKIKDTLGQPVDLLGMNACLMATVEVLYQVTGSADVYVASEELMPAQSWPYTDILNKLASSPDMDSQDLGKMIVKKYGEFFDDPSFDMTALGIDGATLSAVNINQTQALADAVKTLADTLIGQMDEQKKTIWSAQRETVEFQNKHKSYHLYDLGMFCNHLTKASTVSDAVKRDAKAVIDLLKNSEFMLAETHTADDAHKGIMGLTTYIMMPGHGANLSRAYKKTAYAKETNWYKLLQKYFSSLGI